jgi:hypothetical protein
VTTLTIQQVFKSAAWRVERNRVDPVTDSSLTKLLNRVSVAEREEIKRLLVELFEAWLRHVEPTVNIDGPVLSWRKEVQRTLAAMQQRFKPVEGMKLHDARCPLCGKTWSELELSSQPTAAVRAR